MHPPKYLESKRVKQSCIDRKSVRVNLYPLNFPRIFFLYLSIFLLLSKAEILEKYWASTQLRLPDILLHIWMNQWPPVFPPIIYQLLSKTDLGCIHDQNIRELFQSFSWYLGQSWEMIPKGMGYEYFIIFMVFLPSYNPFRQKNISMIYRSWLSQTRFDQLFIKTCFLWLSTL